MTTSLTKAVRRITYTTIRDRSKHRRLVVSLQPGGFFGLRLEGCRKMETLDFASAWSIAVKQRVAQEIAHRKAARKAKREGRA